MLGADFYFSCNLFYFRSSTILVESPSTTEYKNFTINTKINCLTIGIICDVHSITVYLYGLFDETVYNNCGIENLEKELENLKSVAEGKNQCMMVMGDMNARIGEQQGKLGDRDVCINERASKDLISNTEGKR